jgi:hypothetical protein
MWVGLPSLPFPTLSFWFPRHSKTTQTVGGKSDVKKMERGRHKRQTASFFEDQNEIGKILLNIWGKNDKKKIIMKGKVNEIKMGN